MLTKMKLGNFKSWRELDIDLAPITLLFGTNSSGKTSILHALLLLKQTANSFDRGQHINFGGSERDYVDFGSYRDLVYGHDENRPIDLSLSWLRIPTPRNTSSSRIRGRIARSVEYAIKWEQISDQVVIDELTYEASFFPFIKTRRVTDDLYELETPTTRLLERLSSDVSPVEIQRIQRRYALSNKMIKSIFLLSDKYGEKWLENLLADDKQGIISFLRANGISRKTIKPLQERLRNEKYADTPQSCYIISNRLVNILSYSQGFEQLMGKILYLGPLREHPKRNYLWTGGAPQAIEPTGKNAIEALIASKRGRSESGELIASVSSWLASMGLVSEFEVEATDRDKRFYETLVKIGDEILGSSLLDVGFGISQVLPVLTLLFFAPEASIVLIEQPELHLHPSAQVHLADLFLQVAETRKLQLIIESHSEHLLRRFQRRIAEPEYAFATPDNIKAYFCETGANGSTIRSVEVDEYGQIRNWPDNFFGDLGGDLDAMMDAALERRRQELSESG